MYYKYKHLTIKDREDIETMLKEGLSFRKIALNLNADPTTISKEIKRNRMISDIGALGRIKNRCIHRTSCHIIDLCENKTIKECRYNRCSTCPRCNLVCPNYIEDKCSRLNNPPYVCNGCSSFSSCVLKKYLYDAKHAHNLYKNRLTESRMGFHLNLEELIHIESVIKPLINKGQSLHHIVINNKDVLMVSERTLYRLIDSNEMDIKNIDLPRKVRYKPRAKSKQFVVDKDYRKGRTYDDFINFISENPDINVVQMDTLEGVKGGAVLLTLHFLNTNLQLSYLRETNTARSISDVFEYLYNTLGHDDFTTLFPVILTDMGNEFTNPKAIEFNSSGERRTRIFYCNPKCPEDKGSCEKNHVEIRKILPKGRSFNNLNQHDINLVMSHVNSYCRKKLNGKSPYLSFNFIYGESILNKLGINYIPPNDVILKPSLIKK